MFLRTFLQTLVKLDSSIDSKDEPEEKNSMSNYFINVLNSKNDPPAFERNNALNSSVAPKESEMISRHYSLHESVASA